MSCIGMALRTGNFKIDQAFRIALGDMLGNVMTYKSGVLEREVPCLVAGLSCPDTRTRDAAFNTRSGAGLLPGGLTGEHTVCRNMKDGRMG